MTSATDSAQAGAGAPLLLPALLAGYLVWGSTELEIRYALVGFPPFFQTGTCFLAAGCLLLAWVLWRRHRGGAGGLVAAFIAGVPTLVCGWGLLFGQRASRLELAGMAVDVRGVLVLVPGAGFSAAPGALAGIAGATLAWSFGSVLSTTRLRSSAARS